jgi:phage tail-like protein
MANGQSSDPIGAFRFKVELGGVIEAGFAECAGLQAETEVEEIREGGVNEFVHRLAKGSKHPNLTLKRGLTDSEVLWDWHQDVVSGKIERKKVDLILLDSQGDETWRWSFEGAFPVKWIGPELKATGSAVSIETLELAHNGFKAQVKQR